jgi:hypothetical protein
MLASALLSVGAAHGAGDEPDRKNDWQPILAKRLPLLGHRNWIVIADSAYPAQSRPGIETIVTSGEHLDIVEGVLDLLDKSKHVKPFIFLDAELPHIEERDARGITRHRTRLKRILGKRTTQSLPHEDIIDKLDTAAAKFNVLILKTDLTLPYTSVFLELDCRYWSPAAEKRLRGAMKKARNDS